MTSQNHFRKKKAFYIRPLQAVFASFLTVPFWAFTESGYRGLSFSVLFFKKQKWLYVKNESHPTFEIG